MRGLLYLVAFVFQFLGSLLTAAVFRLVWVNCEFNSIMTDTLGVQLSDTLNEPTYSECFWVFMLAGFLRIMFFPFHSPSYGNSKD